MSWHLDLCCSLLLITTALMYQLGLGQVWLRAGFGRGVRVSEVALFTAGWLALAASVLSPLHALGTRVFVAHMAEHELLMLVAAPLLVLSRPAPVLLWALPLGWRRAVRSVTHNGGARRLWRRLTDPAGATVLHGAALWLWHLPAPFQAALFNESVHAAQHISFLVTGLFFWWSVLSREARRQAPGPAVLVLFVTLIHTSLLGALLTLSRGLWYPGALDPFAICGLTRAEDQQLAGLVMWVPAGLAYVAALLWLVGRRLIAERLPADQRGGGHAAARA